MTPAARYECVSLLCSGEAWGGLRETAPEKAPALLAERLSTGSVTALSNSQCRNQAADKPGRLNAMQKTPQQASGTLRNLPACLPIRVAQGDFAAANVTARDQLLENAPLEGKDGLDSVPNYGV